MGLNVILPLVGGLAVVAVLVVVVLRKNRTAYLGPVKEELQKEKAWLRRGEYNAAMVRGRQNLELLLKLVAEKNGIQLDNSAKAQADAKEEAERQSQHGRSGRKKTPKVMTHHQFNRWLSENGYLDRVARWEMNQVRIIGNKAVHENHADKDDAWNQFNYLEDILKTITERSQNPKKRQELGMKQEEAEKKPQGQKKQGKKSQPAAEQQEQPQEQAAKKKRKRRKKSGAKQSGQEVKAAVVAETSQPEQEAEKKKPRRRRRRKKPQNAQNPQVPQEVKQPQEPKKSQVPQKSAPEKETAQSNDGEKKSNPHKRRRRRRPRKPQAVQEQSSSGE